MAVTDSFVVYRREGVPDWMFIRGAGVGVYTLFAGD